MGKRKPTKRRAQVIKLPENLPQVQWRISPRAAATWLNSLPPQQRLDQSGDIVRAGLDWIEKLDAGNQSDEIPPIPELPLASRLKDYETRQIYDMLAAAIQAYRLREAVRQGDAEQAALMGYQFAYAVRNLRARYGEHLTRNEAKRIAARAAKGKKQTEATAKRVSDELAKLIKRNPAAANWSKEKQALELEAAVGLEARRIQDFLPRRRRRSK